MPKSKKGDTTWRSQARETNKVAKAMEGAIPEDESDADDFTMAVMQGDDVRVGDLIKEGADVDTPDAIGVAPIHWAAFCGHLGVCAKLIDAGADVHARDQEGRTPLHVASYEAHLDVVRQLLGAGADVDAPDKMKWTPLHCAVSNGQVSTCKLLVERGAEALVQDVEGKTAFDLAKHFKHEAIIALFEGAQEATEVLALKGMGIGTHRASNRGGDQTSPTSVSSPLHAK